MKLFYIFSVCIIITSCINSKNSKSKIYQVYEDPMHKLVFEKGEVKILDVQIKPQDTTQFHIHSNPTFYVSLGWQKDAGQPLNGKWSSYNPEWPNGEVDCDTSYASKPIVHRATNGGNSLSRIIGIINTGNGITSSYNSKGYEIANRYFRSKRIFLNPRDTANIPKSDFPIVLVVVSGTKLQVIQENGNKTYDTKWFFLEGKYSLVNPSDDKLIVIEIEVLN